jgi:hypothetical protein
MQENFVQTSVLAHSVRRMEHRAWGMEIQLAGVSGQQAAGNFKKGVRRQKKEFGISECGLRF